MGLKKQLRRALSAEQIEKNRERLLNDYQEFIEFSGTDMLKEFLDLEACVNSTEFINNKKKIEGLAFKGSDLWKKEKEFRKLSSDRALKTYLRLNNSDELARFHEFQDSELLGEFNKLEKDVKSHSFNKKENKEKFLRYRELKKNKGIKNFFRFQNSRDFKYYNNIKDSGILIKYEELSAMVNSEDFKNEKDFLLNKNRFRTTDDYKKLEKYNQLLADERIKRYLYYKDSNDFDILKEWELSFEDRFTSTDLDSSKWITRYHSGNEFLGASYSLEGDKHFFTDGDNLEVKNNRLNIITRREKIVGKQWHGVHGFSEEEFDYTSGIISTGNYFRQTYGRFEAKVRFSADPVTQCFWLMSDYAAPHIDVFKTISKSEIVNAIFSDVEKGVVNKIKGVDFSEDFFIYSVIWEKDKIEWRINDVLVWEERDNIPHEPLFLSLGACIYNDSQAVSLPSVMEIDWVRCYKKSQ